MSDEVLIFTGDFKMRLERPFASGGIKAGFPSPAQDYLGDVLDFNRDLITHPAATFYARVKGDSMIDAGIDDGDILVIDRSLEAQDGDIVVAFLDGEFTIKTLSLKHKEDGYIELIPANKNYPVLHVDASEDFVVWGVVAWTIKRRAGRMEM